MVKFCAPVADKMATQTIGAALAFKAGDAVEMALQDGVYPGDRPEVRPAAHQPAEVSGLSAVLKRFRRFANALGDFVARALLAPPHSAVSVCA